MFLVLYKTVTPASAEDSLLGVGEGSRISYKVDPFRKMVTLYAKKAL